MTKVWKLAACTSLLVFVSCASCGGNNDNGSTNGDANNTNNATNNMTNNDVNNETNNETNNTDTNNTDNNNGIADVDEVEPNGREDTPTPFDAGQSVGGTIATGSGETSDVDRFSVELSAGTILEFGVDQTGPDLTDSAVLVLSDEEGQFLTRVLFATGELSSRQAYIPLDGTYILSVQDERSLGEEAVEHGGDDAWYVITTEEVTPTPESIDLPGSTDGDQSDGSIQVYELSPGDDTVVIAETTAAREPVGSDLDTVVIVIDTASGDVVGFNDDFGDSFDSRAVFEGVSGSTYHIVVDAYASAPSGAYSLGLSETDDDISLPTELEFDTQATGTIEARDGDEFDTDYFELTLDPGETARVAISGAGGLEPAVTIATNSFFGLAAFAVGHPVGTDAAVEFAHPSDAEEAGAYLVIVDDVRNIEDPDNPAGEGDAGYTYTLDATTTTWTTSAATLPYTTAGSIPDLGNLVLFEFTIPAGHLFVGSATTTAADFNPAVVTRVESGITFATTEVNFQFAESETTAVMGVRDEFFRGGAGYDFTPNFRTIDIEGATFTPATETEPNDDQAGAESPALPAAVAGVLDGAGEADPKPDWFTVGATAGQAIVAYTTPGDDDATDDADTVLEILDSDGTTVLAFNDDHPGQEMTYFSRAVAEAPADGDYYVVVTPYCEGEMDDCSGNGDYTVHLLTE